MKPYQQARKISTSLDRQSWDRFCQIQQEQQISASALARAILTAYVHQQREKVA